MGVDYEGSMIVGEKVSNLNLDSENIDFAEWVEDNDLDSMSPWYDSDPEYWTVGFRVDSVEVDVIDCEWLDDVKRKARIFFKLTGVKAKLFGEIDIT